MNVFWLPAAEQAARDRGLSPDEFNPLIVEALRRGLSSASNRPRGRRRLSVKVADGRRVEVEYVKVDVQSATLIQDVAIDPDEL